jgi:16S rRNA (uracil1498-N3)-methyltransferase
MHRFFLEQEHCVGEALRLTEREAKHAVQILRLRHGDRCVVLNGAGDVFDCQVESARRNTVELKILARKRQDPLPARLTLFQALPKGKLIENIIQKATELGAARIVPVLSARVISLLDNEAAASRAERWRQTAIEAIKQCGTPWLPAISAPMSFKAALAEIPANELTLVASLQPDRRPVREVVEEFRKQRGRKPATACLWVGPEGDLTPDELAALRAAGSRAITLGRNVLRADTAAIAGLAVLMNELEPSLRFPPLDQHTE